LARSIAIAELGLRSGVQRLTVVIFLLVCLAGCRGGSSSTADREARQATTNLLNQVQQAQYGSVWESMHPAQQAIVPREQLVACGERFGPAFEGFEIGDVSAEDVTPEEVGAIKAQVVSVNFDLTDEFDNGLATPIDRRFRFVKVDDTWRWLLGSGELAVFRDGNCGLPWPGGATP
jgi:hypothetical protein